MVVQRNNGNFNMNPLSKFPLSTKVVLATFIFLISGLNIASYSENGLPLCYIKMSNGRVVNLNSICGKNPPEIQQTQRLDYSSDINPNYAPTPAPVPPTLSDMISPVPTPYPYDTNLDPSPYTDPPP